MTEYVLNEDMNRIYERLVERADNPEHITQQVIDGGIESIEVRDTVDDFIIYDSLDGDAYDDLYLLVYADRDMGEQVTESEIISKFK